MSSAVTRPTDFWAAQVEETTFSAVVSKTGFDNNKTKSADSHTMDKNMRPLFLRSPETLFLIAEIRNTNVGLSNVVTEAGHHPLRYGAGWYKQWFAQEHATLLFRYVV